MLDLMDLNLLRMQIQVKQRRLRCQHMRQMLNLMNMWILMERLKRTWTRIVLELQWQMALKKCTQIDSFDFGLLFFFSPPTNIG